MEKIILVDGSSVLFRGYYALPKFSTSNNIPTNAVYGFLRMLLKIIKDERPSYIAVAFDKKAPTFRHIEFKEYKSNRPKMPDDLSIQFEIAREILDAFKIKYFELDGFEADDIIGTMVEKLKNEDLQIFILSSDFDLAQLIDEKVELLVTRKGVTKIERFDKSKFLLEFGFEPQFLVDYKALLGDVSDNIDGIKGIGEKTASKLIAQYKTVENLLSDTEAVQKYGILDSVEKLLRNKSLCSIVKNVPIEFKLEELRLPDFRTELVKQVLKKYEFKSILKELKLDNDEDSVPLDIFSQKAENFTSKLQKVSLQENEDSALEEKIAVIYTVSSEKTIDKSFLLFEGKFYEFDFSTDLFLNPQDLALLKRVIGDPKIVKYTNSLKHLFRLSHQIGANHPVSVLLDSTLALYLIDPDLNEFTLSELSKYIGKEASFQSIKDEMAFLKEHGNEIIEYLNKEKLLFVFQNIEMPLSKVLFEMERKGIRVDVEYFKALKNEIDAVIEDLEKEIFNLTKISFNILSSKQLNSVLFDVLGIEPPKDYKGGTGTSILMEIIDRHPVIPLIINYRHLVKLRNTYIEPIPRLTSKESGKLHTIYHQIGTSTGRLRSTNPNLQNLPVKDEWGEKIQKGFIASNEDRILVSADYSQIELRILAHLSQDENLINAFMNDMDIHKRTAMEIFNLKEEEVSKEKRNLAKAINFGIIYGMSPYGLSKQIGISKEEASEYINRYFKNYPKVYEYIMNSIELAKATKETRTIFGRRRFIKDLEDKNALNRENAKRVAINSPIQGSAADIIKLAMVEISEKLNDVDILLQIHDELVLEVDKTVLNERINTIKEIMENVVTLKVPLKVDISYGRSLGEARK